MEKPTILVDVDSDGEINVYWHDPARVGEPEISVVYSIDRDPDGCPVVCGKGLLIDDHDSMKKDQDTEQIF